MMHGATMKFSLDTVFALINSAKQWQKSLLLTKQYINSLSCFVYQETITLMDKVTPVLTVEVRLQQTYVEAA